MRRLTVENFSCIKNADLSFGRLTVVIGPQASGKSVLCKLSYFLMSVLLDQSEAISAGDTLKQYENSIKDRFLKWFPIQAWGSGKFIISFSAGLYKIVLTRKTYAGKPTDDFRLKFSIDYVEQYEGLLSAINEMKNSKDDDMERILYHSSYQVSRISRESIKKLTGEDWAAVQTFVPAGRSFFTSVGKAVTAFDHSGLLDPLTVTFGRMFASFREHRGDFIQGRNVRQARMLDELLELVLGGKYVNGRDAEYVQATDGRKIPLSALSSGQQELLPLVTIFPGLLRGVEQQAFIEEPEAHLFPSAQSKIVEAFAMVINQASDTDIVITTHSPYVLVKLNNLIKAGEIADSVVDKRKLNSIVSRRSWLQSGQVKAFAIIDGILVNILDEEGFIDGAYLDDVSGQLEIEFQQLMMMHDL